MNAPAATELALVLFTLCNALRIVAYLPQLFRVMRDRDGASAISYLTWSMFTLANLSTAAYGMMVLRDTSMALIFLANTLCCFAIVVATAVSRRSRRRAQPHGSPMSEALAAHRMGD